jgi:hypothetical protein
VSRAPQSQPAAATPAPAPAPVVAGSEPISYKITLPRTVEDIKAIKERRTELSNQLISAADRRSEIARELRRSDAPGRTGLEQRMAVLDTRILQLESDIARSGQELANAPPALVAASQVPFGGLMEPHVVEKVSIMFTLFVLAPIAVSVAWAIFRRTMRPSPKRVEGAGGGERLERLEAAVDAIAVEIERISEGQRFVTRLLTEQAPNAALGSRQGQGARLGSRSEP